MGTIDPEIEDYLTRSASTLGAFDSQGPAALWATPGILDDRLAGVLEDRGSMAQGLEQSYPLYRELGLASVGHECLRAEVLTDRITLVEVRWFFRDADGEQLTDSHAFYVVRRDDDGIHACVCIQTDDAEKLQALAEERGVDLTRFTS